MTEELKKLKTLRNEISERLFDARKKSEELLGDEKVKSYLENSIITSKCTSELEELDKQIKVQEMKECNHVWITSKKIIDRSEYHTCIKCGLDTHGGTLNNLVMHSILKESKFRLEGIQTDIVCDSLLAQRIYSRILKAHPEIDDETAVKYLESALDNIRNNSSTYDLTQSRIKRLGLNPGFNNWDKEDIIIG